MSKERFNKAYLPLWNNDTPVQIVYGGSSSGKSYSVTDFKVLEMMQGRSILAARKVASTLRKSIFSEVCKTISDMGLSRYFTIRKSDMEIRCNTSTGSIMFIGLDDVEKIKSITPPQASAFDILWIEEATEVSENDYNQLCIRMRGLSDFAKKVVLTFNPIYQKHWIYKRFFEGLTEEEQKGYASSELLVIHTTYKDNKYLSHEEIKVLEDYKYTSPYHYNVYALGNFGVLGSRIFENWKEEDFDMSTVGHLPDYVGGDFGYTNDPTAVGFSKFDEVTRTIYIYDEIYGKGMSNDLIAERVLDKYKVWGIEWVDSYWDSAEPKSIDALLDNGLYGALATSKGQGSIMRSIDWLQTCRIVVHPRCVNLIEELMLYVWEEKDGTAVNKPIDKHNHMIDGGLRYAYSPIWSVEGRDIYKCLA